MIKAAIEMSVDVQWGQVRNVNSEMKLNDWDESQETHQEISGIGQVRNRGVGSGGVEGMTGYG